MPIDTDTLIWLFPIAYMCHDFEEIILSEQWLKKNAGEIKELVKSNLPSFMATQIEGMLDKPTAELALAISLIFALTIIATLDAVIYREYGFFLLASGAFFLHSWLHIGQAIALRRYVPAVITSVVIIIPYGLVLYWKLVSEGIVEISSLVLYWLVSLFLTIPFILVMRKAGEFLYRRLVRLLVGQV